MYKQISPAEGWYFVSAEENTNNPIIFAIAAWALTDNGEAVIGLIGDIRGGGNERESSSYKMMARLVSVPPIEGEYKHKSAMTEAQLQAAKPAALRKSA